MWDDFSNYLHFVIGLISIVTIIGLGCVVYNLGKNVVNESIKNAEQYIAEVVEKEEIINADEVTIVDSDKPNYVATLVKDANGQVVGIMYKDETGAIVEQIDIAADKNTTNIDRVEMNADTIVNTESYVDNSQSIVNEAPAVSYVIPLTIAVIAVFLIVLFDRYAKHKKEKAAYTEKILATPLETYSSAEVDQLMKKYQ